MKRTSKVIGSIMMVLGTTIGSGMLALPLVIARSGFILGSILLVVTCLMSTLSGFLIIDLNFTLPANSSNFNSIAQKNFGKIGQIIIWVGYLFLLYTLLVVAIVGESELLVNFFQQKHIFSFSYKSITVLFTLFLGSAVFWSTSAVDYLNRIFFSLKGLALLVSLGIAFPKLSSQKLFFTSYHLTTFKALYLAVPSFMSAFCFHFIIPSLRLYVGENKKILKKIVLVSSIIALIIYIWWLATCLGLNLRSSLNDLSMGQLNTFMIATLKHPRFTSSINFFTNVTLTTAFLGTALGLFDFLAEGLKRSNDHWGRFQTTLLTFIPPLTVAFFFHDGFIKAVNFAAFFIILLCFIFPLLAAKKSIPSHKESFNYSSWQLRTLFFLNGIFLIINIYCMFNG